MPIACIALCAPYKNMVAVQKQLIRQLNDEKLDRMWTHAVQHPFNSSLPVIYMITPTYQRWTQKADLTRLCYTLMHVPNLHWIVVEDAENKSLLVKSLLSQKNSCKVRSSTHLNVRTPKTHRRGPKDPVWLKSRGVQQRNLALSWLRDAAPSKQLLLTGHDVVYFGDDDNVYDLRVFEEVGVVLSVGGAWW